MSNLFVKELVRIFNSEISEKNIENLNESVMKAFLKYASETPCNLSCFNHINFGKALKPYGVSNLSEKYGFKLKNKNIFISSIVYEIENLLSEKVPDLIKEDFPEISQEDWEAVLRFMTIIFNSFEVDS